MKIRKLYLWSALAAVLCVIIVVGEFSFYGVVTNLFAFPFEQIGWILKKLSLLGRIGNGCALTLYTAICLLPICYIIHLGKEQKQLKEDILLLLLSGLLFFVLALMANESQIKVWCRQYAITDLSLPKAVLGCSVYSVFIGYVILRFLRSFFESNMNRMSQYLKILLILLNFLFVLLIFGTELQGLLEKIETIKQANTASSVHLEFTIAFLILRYLGEILPYVLDIVTVIMVLRLLDEMRVSRYSEDCVDMADRLAIWCKQALTAVIVCNILISILQLICAGYLVDISSTLEIPVFSILFVLVVLFVARMISENHQLKDDNDLFI